MKNNQCGRSMIEMLGVLAIIAVLSVGGIAGYSKAMSMYKLNKWYDNLVQMITNVQTAYINQKSYGDSHKDLTSMFVSTGIIPKEILDKNNKDILGNTLNIFTSSVSATNGVFRINFYHKLPAGKEAVACCKKLYESSQYFPSMWAVDVTDFKYVVCGKAAPEIYRNYYNCQPYDLAKVATECIQCETKNCEMNFIFDNSMF